MPLLPGGCTRRRSARLGRDLQVVEEDVWRAQVSADPLRLGGEPAQPLHIGEDVARNGRILDPAGELPLLDLEGDIHAAGEVAGEDVTGAAGHALDQHALLDAGE